jgi:hypothetical protein
MIRTLFLSLGTVCFIQSVALPEERALTEG